VSVEALPESRIAILFGNIEYEIPEPLRIAEGDLAMPTDPENECMFHIMAPKHGDKRVVWDRRNIAEILAAEKMFKELIAQGMLAFYVDTKGKAMTGKDGTTLKPMPTFDAHAGKVIFMPMSHPATGKPIAVGG
jgi:hypothetical protein